jgi:hypothetical protein
VWVVRHATPQPEVTVVSNCDDMETRQPLTFQLQSIHGWGVHFECVIEYLPGLMSTIVPELTADLQHINTLLPAPILSRLQSTRFFVVASTDAKPTAQMRERGGALFWDPRINVARRKVPELYSASIVINAQSWSGIRKWQPAGATLHEVAHAWHCMNWNPCFAGATEIRAAYDAAMTSGIYDLVDRNDGNREKAYAATNDHEYFADLTEAWFWENDFYPYNREQLLTHDPVGAAAVEAAWTVNG